ncbi:putative ABC transporter permease protein YtcP [Clostridium beijerinckii]|jgi:ABC-type sugar transport system, permease component|uniref:Carbohydrate ABC transporter permease n=1 Tax=Clostridium beijerinckii TaxID=1520 RepID=A0AB74VF81_CLOBE|nr:MULTISPECIES: carbohydrate ABC transporter permease [Clostridium]AVK48673.1 ABC transporter permease [Clostridium sp. MF28]NRZ29257.1 putative aldouronate transport system permease protein [Clostridium beijerinckii]NYB94972.1 putative aldouronate transport system permease protein [Clostridium beijerinckii]OOM27267.1 inner membrane ABC transporter permease protein YcjP [Clostridium beijerinckii]PSM57451.1 carbohydrate ABC transporter permease [Clostridium diolis]
MLKSKKFGSRLADAIIWSVVIILTTACLFPLINMVAISFSNKSAAAGNLVGLLPVDFTLSSYKTLLQEGQFWRSFGISVSRVILGTALNLILVVLMAYPLSKGKREFRFRNIYMNLMIFAMLFSGGMIPIFITVKNLHLLDTIWSLILPGAVPIFNVILLMNFFKSVPKSLEEAAELEGCNKWQILFKIYIPISLPALATISLFSIVGHWNDFFGGLLYINKAANYPLQTYIQQLTVDITKVTNPAQLQSIADISNKTLNAAKIVVSTIPLLIIYPFLQKYFVTGMVMGSVKE